MAQAKVDGLRSVHTTPQSCCVTALHPPAQKVNLNLNAVMLRWFAEESHCCSGTELQFTMNGLSVVEISSEESNLMGREIKT